TLAAGLYLIPGVGIQRTFLIAAAINGLVGISAIAIGRSRFASVGSGFRTAMSRDGEIDLADRARTLVLIVFAFSGFASLALEVVWFRVLTLFLRPTVYGFAVMLATILAGIAAGSYAVTPLLDRRARWIAIL